MKVKSIYNTMEYGPAPESSSAAKEWLDKHNRKFSLFIDGQWQTPASLNYFQTINPANKEFFKLIGL